MVYCRLGKHLSGFDVQDWYPGQGVCILVVIGAGAPIHQAHKQSVFRAHLPVDRVDCKATWGSAQSKVDKGVLLSDHSQRAPNTKEELTQSNMDGWCIGSAYLARCQRPHCPCSQFHNPCTGPEAAGQP